MSAADIEDSLVDRGQNIQSIPDNSSTLGVHELPPGQNGAVGNLLFDLFILRYRDDPRVAEFCCKVGLPVPEKVSAA
jgi:hypothetical protein